MSGQSPPAGSRQPTTSGPTNKTSRVLACVLCQQRKVKCDRQFPCGNCTKAHAACVPSKLLPRQRRRRYAERDLLTRLRLYEDLLRQNNIAFESLEGDPDRRQSVTTEADTQGDEGRSGTSPANSATYAGQDSTTADEKQFDKSINRFRNVWHVMSRSFREDDDEERYSSDEELNQTTVKQAWLQSCMSDDYLLFGSVTTGLSLSALHPDPVQIFRLWQVYLDNVNPIFKVTHTPTLQGQIIEAASNVTEIKSSLEPLMFSIYCVAMHSLTDDQCRAMFNVAREDTLKKYQFACQQALCEYNFLRTFDRNCLTALFLYLVSVGLYTVTPSLSSLLAVVVRIAQRMGVHSEAILAQSSVMEAEMRRRLWWAIVLFDSRITGLSGSKIVPLDPTWTCRPPLNINDSDLRADMKEPPKPREGPTDALFAAVRAEVGDTDRHSPFALTLFNPALKPLLLNSKGPPVPEAVVLRQLSERIEREYFQQCDEENPLHYMTMWMIRTHLAKSQLLEHHASHANSSVKQSDADLTLGTSYALRALRCDTKIMGSPVTQRFRWINEIYFPLPAYIHLIQELKKRPIGDTVQEMWDAMSEHYMAWLGPRLIVPTPIFHIISKLITSTWDVYETAMLEAGRDIVMPDIVASIKACLMATDASLSPSSEGSASRMMENLSMDITPTFAYSGFPYSMDITPAATTMPTMPAVNVPMAYASPWNGQMAMPGWQGGSNWQNY